MSKLKTENIELQEKIDKLTEELKQSRGYITHLKHNLDRAYDDLEKTKEEAQDKIAELESELEVKDNLLKIKNGLCKDCGTTKININEKIKVKLTPIGAEIYYKQYDELNKNAGKTVLEPRMPKIDKDGYTEFQLWHFIELYGQHIGMCKPNVIEPLDIVYCGNDKCHSDHAE